MTSPHIPTDIMYGWKVMRITPDGSQLLSGADSRIRLPVRIGRMITMPAPGLWMSLDKAYVLAHYAQRHDREALLCLSFDPADVTAGNLTDRETEFAVSRATLLSSVILPSEE